MGEGATRPPVRSRRGAGLAFVTTRPVAITMFVLAMAVFGGVSLSKLSLDLLPEISYPTLTVRTSWPGAAPEDVEERISERVQETLSTLNGLVRSTSVSRAGASDVILEFDWGTPMTFAVQDVRERLDGVFLPPGSERPLILRYDPNLDPILRIGIRAPEGHEPRSEDERVAELIQLRWLAENRIKRELETLEGVAAVQVRGGLQEEIKVRVDPHKLSAHRIDPSELAQRLAQENINASGGSLLEGSTEYLVRTVNQFRSVAEIEELPVARRGDAVIRVRDVAKVERTYEKREVTSRIGGAESVELAVFREAGSNVVKLAELVRDRVFGTPDQQAAAKRIQERGGAVSLGDREQADYIAFRMRDEARLELLSDQSVFIEDAVSDVQSAAILGAAFAILVIWLFLGKLSATVIIGLSIPISIIVTFAPMYMAGVSLNIMSLGGLALGVGMLVDNAIVVLESITRCRDEGDDLARAAVRGVAEVSGAVTASTLTTISVFAPIVFVTGIAGQIFGDQALTVVSSLTVSLLVAVFFIPMLASRRFLAKGTRSGAGEGPDAGAPAPTSDAPGPSTIRFQPWGWATVAPNVLLALGKALLFLLGLVVRLVLLVVGGVLGALFWITRPVSLAFETLWRGLEGLYPRLLRAALAHPLVVVVLSGVLLWDATSRVRELGVELLPEIHQGEFTAMVKLEIGTPLEETDRVMRGLDERIRALPGVETTALNVGVEQDTLTREVEGPHTARLTVRLKKDSRTPEQEVAIEREVVRILSEDAAVVPPIDVTRPTPFALEDPIAVEIKGYDLEELAEVSHQVERRLEGMPELSNVSSTLRPGHPEARVTFDREKTLEFGLDLATVSNMVRDQMLGNVSTRYHEGDERIGVRVIGDEVVLDTLEAVLDLPVNPSAEASVPLRAVAHIDRVQGPAEIRRIGNSRAIVVSATGTGLDLGGLSDRIQARLASLEPPADVTVELGGQKREMDEAQESMRFALILAVFLVYVVMASQFESLVQPLIILLTVPLAGVGVIYSLDVLSVPLSVVVFIGLIMLAGIVVNNAIVLVDRINQKRDEGLSVEAAILEAGRARLRPILMTTTTTVLGLLPLTGWLHGLPWIGALGAGEGAEIRAPMAITVITGLTASTILTLLVIPTAYKLVGRRSRAAEALGGSA